MTLSSLPETAYSIFQTATNWAKSVSPCTTNSGHHVAGHVTLCIAGEIRFLRGRSVGRWPSPRLVLLAIQFSTNSLRKSRQQTGFVRSTGDCESVVITTQWSRDHPHRQSDCWPPEWQLRGRCVPAPLAVFPQCSHVVCDVDRVRPMLALNTKFGSYSRGYRGCHWNSWAEP